MRALVTGAAGFVGRHMAAELRSRGWNVKGVDLKGEDLSVYKVDMHEFISGAWGRLPTFDLVVHCAYYVGGRAAIDGVNMNLARNLELDAALFEWAVRTGQPRVLYFSSSAAYPWEAQSKQWLDLHPIGDMRLSEGLIDLKSVEEPDADYGWAKLTGERLAARARANGVNVHVVRPFSGFGEDQNADEYPFPAIVQRAREGDLTVWGPEGQTRDWIHIDDVVAGALAVVDADYQEPVNLCTGIGTEMGDLARMIWDEARPLGSIMPGVEYLTEKPAGVFYRVGDPTLMQQFYTPKITLAEGIRRALNVPS